MTIKKLIFFIFSMVCLNFLSSFFVIGAPSFDEVSSSIDTWEIDTSKLNVSNSSNLEENIKNLFHPDNSSSKIRTVLSIAGVGILIIFLIWGGYLFIVGAGDEGKIKKARMNFLYILYGAFLFFGATWILSTALNVGSVDGTNELIDNFSNQALFQVLAFFKAFAFFAAIIMIAYYGFRIMQAYENEEKIKEGRAGLINVLLALIFIRVIDYLYYIAQNGNFKTDAAALIVNISKVMGYILGILLVISILYAGSSLVLSKGNPEKRKKAKGAIQTVLIVTILVFLFLLIIHQVLSDVQVENLTY